MYRYFFILVVFSFLSACRTPRQASITVGRDTVIKTRTDTFFREPLIYLGQNDFEIRDITESNPGEWIFDFEKARTEVRIEKDSVYILKVKTIVKADSIPYPVTDTLIEYREKEVEPCPALPEKGKFPFGMVATTLLALFFWWRGKKKKKK